MEIIAYWFCKYFIADQADLALKQTCLEVFRKTFIQTRSVVIRPVGNLSTKLADVDKGIRSYKKLRSFIKVVEGL